MPFDVPFIFPNTIGAAGLSGVATLPMGDFRPSDGSAVLRSFTSTSNLGGASDPNVIWTVGDATIDRPENNAKKFPVRVTGAQTLRCQIRHIPSSNPNNHCEFNNWEASAVSSWVQGDEYWGGMSFYLPSEAAANWDMSAVKSSDRWVVIMQHHNEGQHSPSACIEIRDTNITVRRRPPDSSGPSATVTRTMDVWHNFIWFRKTSVNSDGLLVYYHSTGTDAVSEIGRFTGANLFSSSDHPYLQSGWYSYSGTLPTYYKHLPQVDRCASQDQVETLLWGSGGTPPTTKSVPISHEVDFAQPITRFSVSPNPGAITFMGSGVDPGPFSLLEELAVSRAYIYSQLAASVAKLGATAYPHYTDANGNWVTTAASGWNSGFFPGSLWLAYEMSGDSTWLTRARTSEAGVESQKTSTANADTGFKIMTSYGQDFRLTGSATAKSVCLTGATSLDTRWNATVGMIRHKDSVDGLFHQYIDCLMNLELLFLSAANGGSSTHYDHALATALKIASTFIRADGSTRQCVWFNESTGAVDSYSFDQGYSADSCWSRGQAWAIHGLAIAYGYSGGNTTLRDAARKVADWWITNVPDDGVPYWDFNAPGIPNEEKDTSAAAIAAAGLFKLASLDATNATRYRNFATWMVADLASIYETGGLPLTMDSILAQGASKHATGITDVGIIYGDYYYQEAMVLSTQFPDANAWQIDMPFVCNSGDLIILVVVTNNEFPTPTPPAGFTLRSLKLQEAGNRSGMRVFTKFATAGETGPFSVNWDVPVIGNAAWLVYRGVNPLHIYDVLPSDAGTYIQMNAASTSISTVSVTPISAGAVILAFAGAAPSPAVVKSATWNNATERVDSSQWDDGKTWIGIAEKVWNPGDGAVTLTASSALDNYASATYVLQPILVPSASAAGANAGALGVGLSFGATIVVPPTSAGASSKAISTTIQESGLGIPTASSSGKVLTDQEVYEAYVMAKHPVVFYRMAEASGAVQDSSGNGNHATAWNTWPTYSQPGGLA